MYSSSELETVGIDAVRDSLVMTRPDGGSLDLDNEVVGIRADHPPNPKRVHMPKKTIVALRRETALRSRDRPQDGLLADSA